MISKRDKIIFDWVTYNYLAKGPGNLNDKYTYEDAHRDSTNYPPCNENFVISKYVLKSELIAELFK